jgi:DNA invertase Pin-like site-specific DNA recombinase
MTRALILNAVSTPEQARKFSLNHQEEVSRAYCTAQGWDVIDSLRSDTSRSKYDNIDDIARVNKAFAALRQHIEAKDFDVLVIHSFDRLARDASLIVQVIQRVIRAGAVIWAHQGGQVDATNYLILSGSIAFMVAAPIRTFVEKSSATREKQAQTGLHSQGQMLMIHRAIRDGNGKRIGMEINEAVRPLFSRLVELLCDSPTRLSWLLATQKLNEEGYRTPRGDALYVQLLYRTVIHPEFWGHTARNYGRNVHARKLYGYEWVFDPDVPPPAGVRIYHNTHPAFLPEAEANKLKARLAQDFTLKGKARHGDPITAFTGLLVCEECGSTMGWRSKKNKHNVHTFATCDGRWYHPPICTSKNIISGPQVHAALDQRLREMTNSKDLSAVSPAEVQETHHRVRELQAAVANAERELSGLLRDKATTSDPDVLAMYPALIAEASTRLRAARNLLQKTQLEAVGEEANEARHRAAQEIIDLTVDGFWQLDLNRQNRLLHQLFGKYRLVVQDRKVVGIALGKRSKRVP